jgi:hypothetical protein
MSQPGHGNESLANLNSGTGLAELLSAFVAHGGQMAGSRRWAENPLALTHVRWHGPAGQMLDAARHPGDAGWLTQGERDAWVQLALHYPATSQPTPSGPSAPWVPLDLDRGQAQGLLTAMARSQPSSNATPSWGRASYNSPAPRSGFNSRVNPGDSAFGGRPSPFRSGPRDDPWSPPQAPVSGSYWTSSPQSAGHYAGGAGAPPDGDPSELAGSWRTSQPPAQEMVVIPCVEVELPPTGGGIGSEDFARDYARDVAVHFARAAHTIPQVRELRAWMRGDRLVLAARMVLGMGNRPLTRSEMDGAAQLLADVLAQRTLPYTRMALAEPSEWQAGSQMPE